MEDTRLKGKLDKVGKDLTAKELVKITGLDIHKVFDLDLNFVKRTLYTHHVEKAYELKKAQMRAAQNR